MAQTLLNLYDCDDLVAHHCGYCNQEGNMSVGMSSEQMKIEDYQLLIDRGWRRSGTYIYKPAMDKTCCPLYTIKNESLNFEPSKSQRKLMRMNQKFFELGIKKGQSEIKTKQTEKSGTPDHEFKINDFSQIRETTVAQRIIKYAINKDNLKDTNESDLSEALNLPKLKSKHKRLFRKIKSLTVPSTIYSSLKNNPFDSFNTTLSEFSSKPTDVNRLELNLVRSWPPSPLFKETLSEVHALYAKYQTKIHNDSPLECNLKQFQRFLCISPLMFESYQGPLSTAHGYGSFHYHYRLNGKLIGVGVLDILDKCVSSVYFFYDPEYQFLNLGTYSALLEINLVQKMNKIDPEIKFYYLGFYVYSCRKMRYKGNFKPSFLLDPEVYTWHRIEECLKKLETVKYSRFADTSAVDTNKCEDVRDVMIKVQFRNSEPTIVKFDQFCDMLTPSYVPTLTKLVRGYCQLFGRSLSNKVLIRF